MPRVPVPTPPTLPERMTECADHLADPTSRGIQHYNDIAEAAHLLKLAATRFSLDRIPAQNEIDNLRRALVLVQQIVDGHEHVYVCCCGECHEDDLS